MRMALQNPTDRQLQQWPGTPMVLETRTSRCQQSISMESEEASSSLCPPMALPVIGAAGDERDTETYRETGRRTQRVSCFLLCPLMLDHDLFTLNSLYKYPVSIRYLCWTSGLYPMHFGGTI